MVRRILIGVLVVVLVLFGALYRYATQTPADDPLPLDERLIAAGTPEGLALLEQSSHADFRALDEAFQQQERPAWCGVASSATVLSAMRGTRVSQPEVFTPQAAAVRRPLAATLAGMTLAELSGILAANGAQTEHHFADQSRVGNFRDALRSNLRDDRDYLLINYHREGLGQEGGGHISPVAAYDEASQRVLILDVASYKYPPVWAHIDDVFAAMDTPDSASERSRGWVEVSPR